MVKTRNFGGTSWLARWTRPKHWMASPKRPTAQRPSWVSRTEIGSVAKRTAWACVCVCDLPFVLCVCVYIKSRFLSGWAKNNFLSDSKSSSKDLKSMHAGSEKQRNNQKWWSSFEPKEYPTMKHPHLVRTCQKHTAGVSTLRCFMNGGSNEHGNKQGKQHQSPSFPSESTIIVSNHGNLSH